MRWFDRLRRGRRPVASSKAQERHLVPQRTSGAPSNVTPLRLNTREPEPPSGRRDRFLNRVVWAQILWGGALVAGIAVTFAFIGHSVWIFPSGEVSWARFFQWLISRFVIGAGLLALLRYLYKNYSKAVMLDAAGTMGSETDVSTAIAVSGDSRRDLVLKPDETTEGIEQLRLTENAKSPSDVILLPIALLPVEDKEPAENESEASAAGKKPKAAKKKKPPDRLGRR